MMPIRPLLSLPNLLEEAVKWQGIAKERRFWCIPALWQSASGASSASLGLKRISCSCSKFMGLEPTPQSRDDSLASIEIALPARPLVPPEHQELIAKGVTLIVRPGEVVKWEDFVSRYPAHSVALDGYVYGSPRFDPIGVKVNFNHHEEVNRIATRSTSGQIEIAIKQGLIDAFLVNGEPKLNVYVNHPDRDSSLSVWMLANHEQLSRQQSNPLVEKLVLAEDLLDTTAGAYPIDPKSMLMKELAWVFEPYVLARMDKRLSEMGAPEMANIIKTVGERIDLFTLCQSDAVDLDTRFEVLGGGPGWQLIREIGFYARTELYAEGIKAFVSLLDESNGSFRYSIGKMSPFIRFPIQQIYDLLNRAEGLDPSGTNLWGGSDIIGGSPRQGGSKLRPEEVVRLINSLLK